MSIDPASVRTSRNTPNTWYCVSSSRSSHSEALPARNSSPPSTTRTSVSSTTRCVVPSRHSHPARPPSSITPSAAWIGNRTPPNPSVGPWAHALPARPATPTTAAASTPKTVGGKDCKWVASCVGVVEPRPTVRPGA
jgi:hypothetical protein